MIAQPQLPPTPWGGCWQNALPSAAEKRGGLGLVVLWATLRSRSGRDAWERRRQLQGPSVEAAGVAFAVRNHQYPSLCKGCAVSMLSFAGAIPAVVRLVQKTLDVLRFWGAEFHCPGIEVTLRNISVGGSPQNRTEKLTR